MESAFWDRVGQSGHRVPDDRPLDELTTELTAMLGDPDPTRRDGIAYPTLATWVSRACTTTCCRASATAWPAASRSGSARTAPTRCSGAASPRWCSPSASTRDNARATWCRPTTVLRLGGPAGRLAACASATCAATCPGKGWAHAVAHGADALGALAGSAAIGPAGARRCCSTWSPTGCSAAAGTPLLHGEDDRLALATTRCCAATWWGWRCWSRGWHRLGGRPARPTSATSSRPSSSSATCRRFLRALHLQLALGPQPPACRPDLLLAVIAELKRSNPHYLGPGT